MLGYLSDKNIERCCNRVQVKGFDRGNYWRKHRSNSTRQHQVGDKLDDLKDSGFVTVSGNIDMRKFHQIVNYIERGKTTYAEKSLNQLKREMVFKLEDLLNALELAKNSASLSGAIHTVQFCDAYIAAVKSLQKEFKKVLTEVKKRIETMIKDMREHLQAVQHSGKTIDELTSKMKAADENFEDYKNAIEQTHQSFKQEMRESRFSPRTPLR